ncbi:MAG: glycosyltransferase [Patescibacteria group bacterium]
MQETTSAQKVLVVLPVYNEEIILAENTKRTAEFMRASFPTKNFKIVIADNNSSDRTGEIGRKLAEELPEVEYFFLNRQGKGLAWRQAFQKYQVDIYIVMDSDLAVELEAVKRLVETINDGYDLVVGSRFLKQSKLVRSVWRDFVSRTYRFLARKILRTKVSDFQCGFKAINNQVRDRVLPLTKDDGFFLDTEIIVWAEKLGFKVKEIPVDWSEFRNTKRKSTVKVWETTVRYLSQIKQLRDNLDKYKVE